MPVLTGTDSRIELGGDLALTAPGLRGRAERLDPPAADGTTTRGDEVAAASVSLRDALRDADMHVLHVVDLTVEDQAPPSAEDTTVRAASGEPGMVLEVPDLGDDVGQVVLAVDEGGVVTWNFPVSAGGHQRPTVRGTGDRLRFHIRTTTPDPDPGDDGTTTRGILGRVGRKVLEVIAYRVVGEAVALGVRGLARRYEQSRRPVRVRTFLPGEHGVADAAALDGDQWRWLAEKPSLWFVHGTFSTAHGGFGALDKETLAALHRAYDGRVVAYDHHTLWMDPSENVGALADLVPAGTTFTADLVAHSRGGLVARALAGEGLPGDVTSPLRVRRAVTVGTPHHGTALADPQRVSALLDRVSTLVNLAPDGIVVADVIATVLDVVKVVLAHGLAALPGIAAMDPDGSSLTALNTAAAETGMELYAIAADHEPQGPLARMVLDHLKDAVVDRVFGDASNDVVVPTAGAWEGSQGPLFPVPEERRLVLDTAAGVTHVTYFRDQRTRDAIGRWLTT